MSKKKYDTRLMVKCAQMYYDESLNQADIAEKLQISKSSVSRILSAAREEGVVEVIVNNPFKTEHIKLEKQLEEKFNLKEVIIVDSKSNDIEEIKKELAKASADYLERVIKGGQIIGVTMGTTLCKIPTYVKNDKKHDVTFIPLLGGVGETNVEIHPNSIALSLAKKFRADCRLLHAPSLVDDPDRKEMFIQDKNIQSFLGLMDKVDLAIAGIGFPLENTSTLVESGYFTMEDIKKLEEQGAEADISMMFMDKYGNGDSFESNKRVIGITLEALKKVPLTIGIAGHEHKSRAILATLVGNYIDVLITDAKTAETVLKLSTIN
ncbi:MAG: sugar-binding transcriptional regulator [Clostridiaceae bacterium]|nr:sugar-binding transcriptional regulator [Clostridiaceae bacterium]MBW4859313.1 sugar-binding transcriptional regulator [Clostridiaceae bacterium]MBW4868770.1 sugar-binding transcriptional regulator [Clostridiaceae bacterium]